MPNRKQRKQAKAINKRLGRDRTIKNTNKNRGRGTTKTNLGQGVSRCWNGICEKVDEIVSKDSGKKRKTKISSSRKETTIDKDPSGKRDGINFPNFSLNKLNIGVGRFSKTKIGRRDEYLNIEDIHRDNSREDMFKTKYDDYSDFT